MNTAPVDDPDEWLADYRRRIDQLGARVAGAQRELAGLTATAVSTHNEVTVTVDPSGALLELTFGPRADELSRPRLAQLVLVTARQARAMVAERTREALAPITAGTRAEQLLDRYRPAADRR